MANGNTALTPRPKATEHVRQRREAMVADAPAESVPLPEIGGRTLAEPIVAGQDVPRYDHATMDGYAFDAGAEYPLRLRSERIHPEDDPPSIGADEAVEVATGAPLPPEADAVLKREEAAVTGDRLRGPAIDPGTDVYARGSNVAAGDRLFEAGERLSPKDAVLITDLGIETVPVTDRFSVGVLATGTEIHEGRSADRDSSMLQGLVDAWGHEAIYEGTVPDDYEQVAAAIADLADRHDAVLTTGGTSVGHKDHVVRVLREHGEIEFRGVAVRPGRPIAMATLEDAVVFALPGKPLAAHAGAVLLVRPLFTADSSLPGIEATFARELAFAESGIEYAVPVTLDGSEAMPLGHVDSPLQVYEGTFDPSVLASSTRATRADGFVLAQGALDAGDPVDVVPYPVVE